nr:MAG TPA: portal protein [Caudoviricetes sp.]
MFNWFKKEQRNDNEVIADVAEGLIKPSNTVTKQQAMSIPVVTKSVNWIASAIAALPIKMYKLTDSGYQEVYNDYRLPLLNDYSGNCMTANDLKRQILTDLLLEGNGYAYISKKGNKIEKLSYIPTCKLTYTESVDNINKVINVWVDGRQVQDYNVFRLVNNTKNGISGIGFISDCQELLGTVLNSLQYENSSISSGVRRGFLKSKSKLDSEKMTELRRAWKKLTTPNQSDVLVLNAGIEFEDASSTATESQLSQNKVINMHQILSYFGLPTNFFEGVNSDAYLTAIRIAVLPLVKQFTTALNNFLLLESEKSDIKFEIDTRSLVEIDVNAKYNMYQTALTNGILTIDEVRQREQLPVLDMSYLKLGLGDVLYNVIDGKIFVPNTGQIVDPAVATNDDVNALNDDEQASN